MGLIDLGAIIVAGIAAFGAWAAQRAAAKAGRVNTEVSARLAAEQEAYQRARKFDIETIERQEEHIYKQDEKIDKLRLENHSLKGEVAVLKSRVRKLESHIPEQERLLYENQRTDDH